MKIGTKLIIGFLAIALIVGITGVVSLSQLNKIAKPLNSEIPESIKIISETSNLDGLAQFIRYYDEVLTQSARNYAFTQDKKWKERYYEVVTELDKIIKEAIEKGDESSNSFFSSVDSANLALVEMEEKAIKLVDDGNWQEAVKILESDEYWNNKKIYEKGLREYVGLRGSSYDEALKASTQTLDASSKTANELISKSKSILISLSLLSVVLAIIFGFIVSRSISKPIKELTNVVEDISTGKLDTEISPKLKQSNSEIGRLASAFDRTIVSLKLAMKKNSEPKKENEQN